MEIIGERVEELRAMRYDSKAGEQLRAEVGAYERAMASTGRLLVDLARLGLDERQVRISEAMATVVNGVIRASLAEIGLSAEQLHEGRPNPGSARSCLMSIRYSVRHVQKTRISQSILRCHL